MIVGPNFSFVLNPKAASTSLVNAFGSIGLFVDGDRHKVVPSNKPIRGVVHRHEADRMKSGWRYWGKGQPYTNWKNGTPLEVCDGIDFKTTPQSYWTDNATHVLRFENLLEDWEDFCVEVGLIDLPLKHLNRTL